jgi:hypothetical protein
MSGAAAANKVTKWVGIELVRSGNGAVPKVSESVRSVVGDLLTSLVFQVRATLESLSMTKMHRKQFFVSTVKKVKTNGMLTHMH